MLYMTSSTFTYEKNKVIQALRYHFISRPEIKMMIIVVNIFAFGSAALFFFHKVSPMAFMISSLMWFFLMILFWFILPLTVYRKERTFKDTFTASLTNQQFTIANERGERSWDWNQFSTWLETPYFFHLYFNSRSFFIVPKSAFEGNSIDVARNILREKIARK